MYAIREQECVRMEQNTNIISSESSSSDDLLEASYNESSGSGRSQISFRPVTSYNKTSTFPAKHKSYIEKHPWKNLIRDPSHRNEEIKKNQADT